MTRHTNMGHTHRTGQTDSSPDSSMAGSPINTMDSSMSMVSSAGTGQSPGAGQTGPVSPAEQMRMADRPGTDQAFAVVQDAYLPMAQHNTGLTARGRLILAVGAGCVLLAVAGGWWWLHTASEQLTTTLSARSTAVSKAAKPAQPGTIARAGQSATAPRAGTTQHTAAQTRDLNTEAGGTAAPAHQAPQAEEVLLPSIVHFAPGTVYSGTLGELTRLQAGSQIARADLALREVQVKLKDMERRLAEPGPVQGESAAQLEERLRTSLQASLQASLNASLNASMQQMLAKVQHTAPAAYRVLAVRGQGAALEAVLVSAQGRILVQAGQRLGESRIDAISRTAVLVDGRPLPWLR